MTSQPITTLPFVVADTYIRQDDQGRYCLNDLHKAAIAEGNNARTHEPYEFMRRPETLGIIQAMETTQDLGSSETGAQTTGNSRSLSGPVNTVEGRKGGTFVALELVYTYAMWISPAFHLRVIRTYHSLLTSKQPPRQDLVQARHDRLAKFAFQLVTAIDRAKTAFAREGLLEQLRQVNAELGHTTPQADLLPAFPDPAAHDKATIAAFWDAFRRMESDGARLNHAKDSTLVAVHLAQFLNEAGVRRVEVPSRAALVKALPHSKAPAFLSTKAVNSAIRNGAVHCWVFQACAEPAGDAQPPLFGEAP